MKICVYFLSQKGHDDIVYVFTSLFLKNTFAWFEFYKSGSLLIDHGKMWVPRWDQLRTTGLDNFWDPFWRVTNLATFWATLTSIPWRESPIFLSGCPLMWLWLTVFTEWRGASAVQSSARQKGERVYLTTNHWSPLFVRGTPPLFT